MTKFAPGLAGLIRMGQLFADQQRLQAGDSFAIDRIPGTGTVTVTRVRGMAQGEAFREPEFFNATMRIWLGPHPADWKLEDALLGKPA